jgi:sucrose-6-phosphate hydrolase SacC (GH32 family)
MLGWLRDANYPGMPFGNGMSLPLELSLQRVGDITRLCFNPVVEMEKLRIANYSGTQLSCDQANDLLARADGELLDLEFELKPQGNQVIKLDIRGHTLECHPAERKVYFAGQSAPLQPEKETIHMRVVVDRSVTELFIDHGWGAFSSMTIFDEQRPLLLDGAEQVLSLTVNQLQSIWG